MRLRCDWKGNKILKGDCQGDQMVVNYGGKVGDQDVCEAHAKALQAIGPFSGAKFRKVKQQGGE